MRSSIKEDNVLNTGIDTMEITAISPYTACEVVGIGKGYGITKCDYDIKGEAKRIKLQPSVLYGNRKLIDNGIDHIDLTERILNSVGAELININRIDISVDLNLKLKEYRKLAKLIVLCVAHKKGIKSVIEAIGLLDIISKTIKLKSSRYELTFYTKEDKKLHQAESRIEFRFKRLTKVELEEAIRECLGKIYSDLKCLSDQLKEVEAEVYKYLCCKYEEELKNKTMANFEDFVNEYSKEIITRNIFCRLFKKYSPSKNMKKFLDKVRKGKANRLKFLCISHLDLTTKVLIRELKKYEKSLVKSTL